MGLLLFKKIFADRIRSGEKTTTLRRWDRPRCRPGQRVFAPGIGYLTVNRVDRVTLRQLRLADGFPTLVALRQTLRSIYSPELQKRPLFRIAFTFLSPP